MRKQRPFPFITLFGRVKYGTTAKNRKHSTIVVGQTRVCPLILEVIFMTDKKLLEIADKAMENAYAPYSGFKVGAALLCSDGTVFTGCNVENSSYGAANCAERTAIFKAVSEGHRDFSAIAIVSSGGGETYPCGICRQVMGEFAPEIRIILRGNDGEPAVYHFNELMPKFFTLK